MQNKLYVGNLPFSFEENDLENQFSSFGEIREVKLIRDRESGRSKGFAFVTFETEEAAQAALELNGSEMGGRSVRVNIAIDKPRSGGGGGGGHRGGNRY
ncbi:MAG TPA: RNA-binding protein [Calditrichia bacterium]|nr:RNA-binding protein [Calditrichota bacterium]HQU72025.1 RNA-binding protein [Calditrichia bacterium]HQV33135.1 RNA-binding protein [Calditrichia bacterium]